MEVSYKNISIHYEVSGKGKTLVFLHGFLENLTMWNEIKSYFVSSYRVITIDLLGHGKTPCLGYIHTMEEMAASVAFVLKKHRIRKPVFIGHSMGGYVALAFAEKFPNKIKGLCLLNSTSRSDSKERKEARNSAMQVAKKNYADVIKISIRNLFKDVDKKEYKGIVKQLVSEALTMPKQGFFAAQEGMKLRPNREHILNSASFSKLMITGKHDDLLFLEDQEAEAKRTNTPLVKLSQGHMSHIENKKELLVALNSFCKKA